MEVLKPIKNTNIYNTILVDNDSSINIYNIYYIVNNNVINISNQYKLKLKDLDKLKERGGPGDVGAQQYDLGQSFPPIIPAAVYYKELQVLVKEVQVIEAELENAKKEKNKVMELILEIYQLNRHKKNKDIELTIFVEHKIKKTPLSDLQKKLYYSTSDGIKKRYDYGYLKNVSSILNEKIKTIL